MTFKNPYDSQHLEQRVFEHPVIIIISEKEARRHRRRMDGFWESLEERKEDRNWYSCISIYNIYIWIWHIYHQCDYQALLIQHYYLRCYNAAQDTYSTIARATLLTRTDNCESEEAELVYTHERPQTRKWINWRQSTLQESVAPGSQCIY